jgi:hypothetical protein
MRRKTLELSSAKQTASAEIAVPSGAKDLGLAIAHGAGGNMNDPFVRYFFDRICEAGYACIRFNFFYSQARRKVPDRQQVLIDCFEQALRLMPFSHLVIGGKSMGGRIASYLAQRDVVAGLFFLGYPLHPPGKPDQLRDAHLYSISKPMFFASGTKDPFARFDLLQQTLHRIGSVATPFFVEGGGHSFELPKKSGIKREETCSSVADALLQWLDTNLAFTRRR